MHMKKIDKGKYEVFTTRQDAIDKFMQIQGVCNEPVNGGYTTCFYCYKDGKIYITDPAGHRPFYNATKLKGEIIEEDGKTYVSFYTTYSKTIDISNYIILLVDIILDIILILFVKNWFTIAVALISFVLCVYHLGANSEQKYHSTIDSEAMIRELKRRVDTVNNWDK